MNTKRTGNTSEAFALAAFVARGWIVLMPYGDNEPYDLVIDRGNGFERIQTKKGRRYKGCLTFNAYSQPGRRSNVQVSYAGKIDLFAVQFEGLIYLIPESEAGASKPSLRLDPEKKSHPTIRWAKDFLLGPVVP